MYDKNIEDIAQEARRILEQIPFAQQENIDFQVYQYGDPVVFYEVRPDGCYQIVNERGNIQETRVAKDRAGMIDYFVEQAIWNYALRYEVKHRRKFESNLRQMDEVMERCYQYIDPDRKFIHDNYDDEIHIYLDLLDEYVRIASEYREKYPQSYQRVKEDIDFIADKQYADSVYGGMSDVPKAMRAVRDRFMRLRLADKKLEDAFASLEQYYELFT